jgi:hypothetical protein
VINPGKSFPISIKNTDRAMVMVECDEKARVHVYTSTDRQYVHGVVVGARLAASGRGGSTGQSRPAQRGHARCFGIPAQDGRRCVVVPALLEEQQVPGVRAAGRKSTTNGGK